MALSIVVVVVGVFPIVLAEEGGDINGIHGRIARDSNTSHCFHNTLQTRRTPNKIKISHSGMLTHTYVHVVWADPYQLEPHCYPSPLAPPTAPNDAGTPVVNSTSIYITWAPPTDNGGRNDLFYTVAYSNGTYTSTSVNVANNTQYTLTDLTPSTQYIVTVTTNNGVSNQDPDVADRTATINVTTPPRGQLLIVMKLVQEVYVYVLMTRI